MTKVAIITGMGHAAVIFARTMPNAYRAIVSRFI